MCANAARISVFVSMIVVLFIISNPVWALCRVYPCGTPPPPPPPPDTTPVYVVNGITYAVHGPFPSKNGGTGGFFSGGEDIIDAGSIPQTPDLLYDVPSEAAKGEISLAVIYNGPTDDNVSYTVLVYQPASGTWYAIVGVNNSGLSLSDLQALVKTANFLSNMQDTYNQEQQALKNANGGGGGSGSTRLTYNFTLPQQTCTLIIGWNNGNPTEVYSTWSCEYTYTP